MDRIKIYEKPTCTTCRKANKLLEDSGVDFDKVDYYVDAISESKLRELLRKMGLGPRQLLRTKGTLCEDLGISDKTTDDQIIALMVKNPDLIQRPIVEKGDRAVLGRPIENITSLL